MPVLLQMFLGSLVRFALAGVAGYLVAKGAITGDLAEQLLLAAAVSVPNLLWAFWKNYKGRLKFLKALEMPPGADEADVERAVKLDPPKVT